jgi:hypothetical protein
MPQNMFISQKKSDSEDIFVVGIQEAIYFMNQLEGEVSPNPHTRGFQFFAFVN